MRFTLPIRLWVLLLASPAFASGVDIAWDNCLGEPGAVSLKQFACDTNTGGQSLWISFESPVSATTIGTIEVAIGFQTRNGTQLPVWWDFEDFASCRRGGLGVAQDPPYESPTCARFFTSASPPTWVVDRVDFRLPTPDAGRFVVAAHPSGPLLANQRYLACRLQLSHARTATCAGCDAPVSVVVNAVRVDGVILSNAITNNVALWQQQLPTATRNTTWATLKGLYR